MHGIQEHSIRFADDFVILANSEKNTSKILRMFKKSLEEFRCTIDTNETKFITVDKISLQLEQEWKWII